MYCNLNPENPIIAISSEKFQVLWGRGLEHEDLYVENGQLSLVRVCAQGMSVKKTDWKQAWFSNEFITYFGVNSWHVVQVFFSLFSFIFNLKMYIYAFIRGGLF